MEIEHIGGNKIRCALTEQEIRSLGFDIDEIIGDSETTQEFMHAVLGLVEEQEHIRIDGFSPMVKAELMQDHSMAITFGARKDMSFRDLMDTVSHIVSQLDPEHIEEQKKKQKKQEAKREIKQETEQEVKQEAEPVKNPKPDPMVCALRFAAIEHMCQMSRVCFPGRVPKSSLYKLDNQYYLLLDFTGFTKEEMRPFAFGTVEYDDEHYSDMGQIAYITEHGSCIMRKRAIETLMEL